MPRPSASPALRVLRTLRTGSRMTLRRHKDFLALAALCRKSPATADYSPSGLRPFHGSQRALITGQPLTLVLDLAQCQPNYPLQARYKLDSVISTQDHLAFLSHAFHTSPQKMQKPRGDRIYPLPTQ